MAVRDVIIWPDETLLVESEALDLAENNQELVNDLIETMTSISGIGLAAPQVGISKRCFVINGPLIDEEKFPDNIVLINPVLLDGIGSIVSEEGCLSIPEVYVYVNRADTIFVEYFDQQGNKQELTATGLLSIAIQHEIDHLDGILIAEKMNRSQRRNAARLMKKIKAKGLRKVG